MLLRLMPYEGGDGTVYGLIAMNDTGSDILSLFHSDLQYLGNIQGYSDWDGVVDISCANGIINSYPRICVEVQLVRDDNISWPDWIEEVTMVQPDGLLRFSSYGIMETLYLGTSPGNHPLAIATTTVRVGLHRYFITDVLQLNLIVLLHFIGFSTPKQEQI
jgi:hypothetical protein